jgi:plasmid stabilization system protein ParE
VRLEGVSGGHTSWHDESEVNLGLAKDLRDAAFASNPRTQDTRNLLLKLFRLRSSLAPIARRPPTSSCHRLSGEEGAIDRYRNGIRPDCVVEVRRDVLDDTEAAGLRGRKSWLTFVSGPRETGPRRPRCRAADIEDARAWYERARPGLGEEFLAAVTTALNHISDNPVLDPAVHRDTRRALVPRCPYALFYRAEPDRIRVHRLLPRDA